MYKKKKLTQKKHRKNKLRLKAIVKASLSKVKPVKKTIAKPEVEVEKKVSVRKPTIKKTALKKSSVKKAPAKKTTSKAKAKK